MRGKIREEMDCCTSAETASAWEDMGRAGPLHLSCEPSLGQTVKIPNVSMRKFLLEESNRE